MSFAAEDTRHGTVNGYNNLRCRCDACRAAASADSRRRYPFSQLDTCPSCGHPKKKGSEYCRTCRRAVDAAEHGSESRYRNGCRCDLCRKAAAAGRRVRRRRMTDEQRQVVRVRDRQRKGRQP